jgi:hypothetical protein
MNGLWFRNAFSPRATSATLEPRDTLNIYPKETRSQYINCIYQGKR